MLSIFFTVSEKKSVIFIVIFSMQFEDLSMALSVLLMKKSNNNNAHMEQLSTQEMILINGGDQQSYNFGWHIGHAVARKIINGIRALNEWLNEITDSYVEEHAGVFENCD